MLLLAFDTSTRYCSVALCSEAELLSEYTWSGRNNHSIELLGHIQAIMREHNKQFAQLDAVAVATGPGMFNGVRVGLSTAKALAFASGCRLCGISTLDIVAAQQGAWRGPLCALIEAGREEVYAGTYRNEVRIKADGGSALEMQRVDEYRLTSPRQLAELVKEQCDVQSHEHVEGEQVLFCGEIASASRQAIAAVLGERGVFIDAVQSTRRAATLALLAIERLRLGQADDALVLEPLYLRRPSITKSTRKQGLPEGLSGRPNGQATTERQEGALRH